MNTNISLHKNDYPKESNITFKEKQYLKSVINQLSETEHIEIFKIIRSETDKFTENNNGIFINLSKISDNLLSKILDFVNYCIKNKQMLDNEKKQRDTIIEIVNSKENEESDIESEPESVVEEFLDEPINKLDYIEKMNNIEKDILSSSLKINKFIDDGQKKKYTGVRAKIIKKCKENKNNHEEISYEEY